jgi:predicted nucleotidyltransferase
MRRHETGKLINVEPFLDDLRAYLKTLDGLVAAWIFGSYGTPDQTPLSDLDIALLYRREAVPDLGGQGEVWERIIDVLHEEDVSVTILNRAPILFQFRVLETGRKLLCRNEIALADFIEYVVSRHADFRIYLLKEHSEAQIEQYIQDEPAKRSLRHRGRR